MGAGADFDQSPSRHACVAATDFIVRSHDLSNIDHV